MSNYKQDKKAEERISEFLDEYYYSWLNKNTSWTYERVTNVSFQKKGMDIICTNKNFSNKIKIIDEKCSLYFLLKNSPILSTFAFELENLNSGNIGWFINPNIETTEYILMWGKTDCEKISEIDKFSIKNLEIYHINKKELEKKINSLGVTQNILEVTINKIKKEIKNLKINKRFLIDSDKDEKIQGMCIYYSGNLAERPLNLLISKDILKDVAHTIYKIEILKTSIDLYKQK